MILIRHGQTIFNLHYGQSRIDPGVADPGLTELGREQARAAGEALLAEDVAEILASPYRRTIETASIVAEVTGLPVRIEPLVRERVGFSCDTGTVSSDLARHFPDLAFEHLDEQWWHPEEEAEALLVERCTLFRSRMAEHPEWHRIAVVTHWGVIRALTGLTAGNGELIRFDPTRIAARIAG